MIEYYYYYYFGQRLRCLLLAFCRIWDFRVSSIFCTLDGVDSYGARTKSFIIFFCPLIVMLLNITNFNIWICKYDVFISNFVFWSSLLFMVHTLLFFVFLVISVILVILLHYCYYIMVIPKSCKYIVSYHFVQLLSWSLTTFIFELISFTVVQIFCFVWV